MECVRTKEEKQCCWANSHHAVVLYLKVQYMVFSTESQETQRHLPPLCRSFDQADSSTYATPTKCKKYRISVYATTSGLKNTRQMFVSRIGPTAANHITMVSGPDVVKNWRVARRDGTAEENILNMMLWKAERLGPTHSLL